MLDHVLGLQVRATARYGIPGTRTVLEYTVSK